MKPTRLSYIATYLALFSLVVSPNKECSGWNRFKYSDTTISDSVRKPASIMISPIALTAGRYTKLKLRIQWATKKRLVVGTDLKLFFNSYSGFQINPFIKYFMTEDNSKGVYLYGSGLNGMNKKLPSDKTKNYSCYGAGVGIGIQILLGKHKNGLFDIGMGLKYVTTDAALDINHVPDGYDDFLIIGPAAIFDSNLSIGFRF